MGRIYVHPVLEKARKRAFRNIRRVRWMLLGGMIYYGRDVVKREFYLRRITDLSVQVFILLSSLTFIEKVGSEGRNIWTYLDFLEYYLAEIQSSACGAFQIRPSLKDKLHHKVFKALDV